MKHHELIQLRKRKMLVFAGYTQDGREIYEQKLLHPELFVENTEYKFSSKRWAKIMKPWKRKIKIPRYVKPKDDPRAFSYPKRKPTKQTFDKKPRRAYCTGCGFTFTHMYLLFDHRNTEKCGGRFLPEAERSLLKKLRIEREDLDRRWRALENMPPIQLTKAEKKALKAIRVARREVDIAERRSVLAAFGL